MSKWEFKNRWYESIPVNWECHTQYRSFTSFYVHLSSMFVTIWVGQAPMLLLHHKKWGKCYTLERFGYMGNDRNKLKMQLRDIYSGRVCYASAKDVEVVQECTPSLIQATLNLANKKSYVKSERPSNNRICRVGSISKPVARPF